MSDERVTDSEDVPQVFGRRLKKLRIQARMSRAQLGKLTDYSASTIASFEQGRRLPPTRFIVKADQILGSSGLLVELVEDMEEAQFPPLFRDAMKLEKEAIEWHVYDSRVINGLLQTEDYARAVFTMARPLLDEDTVEERVAARLARQKFFTRQPLPVSSFVLEEAVLRGRLGGPAVMRGQLERILRIGQLRNVEIQVMPMDQEEHPALSGPFTLMQTAQGRRLAYVEAYNLSRVFTDRSTVRELEEKYSLLRAKAQTPHKTMTFVEKLLGET